MPGTRSPRRPRLGDNALAIAALARAGCFAELARVDHEMREVEEPGGFSPAVLEAVAAFFNELSA